MIFDTHAHYCDTSFDEDRDELLCSMRERGIGQIVEVGASVQSTKDAVNLAEKYEFVYAAVGIHPEDIARLSETDMDWLAGLTKHERVVAVGEIGLDYHYDEPPKELQRKWFIRQLQVAAQTGMPVIIHSREAARDTLNIMTEYCAWDNGGVIHCFSYSPEVAEQYLKKGFFVGIGGVVTFKNSKKLKEVVEMAPLEQIVLETDAPYLTPAPHRGKRNDSSYLPYVVDMVAGLKQVEREEVIRVTEENAKRLYRLG